METHSYSQNASIKDSSILLVEDTNADAIFLQRAFDVLDIINPVHHVRDGEQALDYLYSLNYQEILSLPGLIILDIKLPRLSGLSVLKDVKQHEILRKIPVIILTTSSQERDVNTAYEYGVNSYLVKPIKFSDFVETVASIKKYWFEKNIYPC